MWKSLLSYGMPPKIVNMIKSLYAAHVCAVQMVNGLSEWFPVEFAVRQGCVLSPILFAILIDFVLRACHFRGGIQLSPKRQIHAFDFADDIVLIAHCQDDIQCNLYELAAKAAPVGLKININKTKIDDH